MKWLEKAQTGKIVKETPEAVYRKDLLTPKEYKDWYEKSSGRLAPITKGAKKHALQTIGEETFPSTQHSSKKRIEHSILEAGGAIHNLQTIDEDMPPNEEWMQKYQREYNVGMNVEKEHKPTLEFIKKYHKEHNKFPSLKTVAASIATDHIRDFKKVPDPQAPSYYQGLINNNLSDEVFQYENGGELNYNDVATSIPEGFVGMGNNTTGRNYSPAWNGQFRNGGEIMNVASEQFPIAQNGLITSPLVPIYHSYQEANAAINPTGYTQSKPEEKKSEIAELIKREQLSKVKQRETSEVYKDPETGETIVQTIGMEPTISPIDVGVLSIAALASGGLGLLGSMAEFANPLPINPLKSTKSLKNFKSEINWAKWNKEIPENTQLLKEYHNIEASAKQAGTWMKNPDGSAFKGKPEQFVQQNSDNFKKSFGNSKLINPDGSPTIQYHGSAKKFDTFDENKFQLGDSGYSGQGIYTTPSKTTANSYATSSSKFHKGDIEPTVYELYGQANNPISSSQLIKENKGRDLFNFHRKKNWKGDLTPEESLMDYDAAIADQLPNVESIRPWNDAREIVFPTNKQLKSAVGNNGMFDMTNPNIYKSFLPIGVGLGATQFTNETQRDPSYVSGGTVKGNNIQFPIAKNGIIQDDNGYWNPDNWGKPVEINSNDITMRGVNQLLMGVSKETGEKKLMVPEKRYTFTDTKHVIELPLKANNGSELKKLDQLTNFTNYNNTNKNWLDRYEN